MEINIGLPEDQRRQSAEALSRILGGTFVLYIKTHNYHWNVTGTDFVQLHQLFETQYNELFLAADVVAERIRALGFRAPATLAEMAKLSPVPEEAPGRVPAAEEMIASLADGHEILCREIRSAVAKMQSSGDEASVNMLTERIEHHEKTAWMLRASLPARREAVQPMKKVASR